MCVALSSGLLGSFAAVTVQSRPWRAFWKLSPVIEYPAKLDLGEREKGDIVVAPFTIANRGGGELLVDEITSNCGCTGIEREENGRYIRLESLRLKPGEAVPLVMRVSVGGPLGATMNNVVEFRTNDPQQPTVHMDVLVTRVSGGVLTTPESVVFGTVPVGGKVRQFVDVWDPAVSPRAITRVTSTGLDRLTVRLLRDTDSPKRNEANPKANGAKPLGVLVGRLEVILKTDRPVKINDTVLIEVAGREDKPDKLPVVGQVAASFEMSPSLIVLPRYTSSGPVYKATCLCRSITGKPVTLTVDSLPSGVTAQVLSMVAVGESTVQISFDPRMGKEQKRGQRQVIRFRAEDGENKAEVDLPIILQK